MDLRTKRQELVDRYLSPENVYPYGEYSLTDLLNDFEEVVRVSPSSVERLRPLIERLKALEKQLRNGTPPELAQIAADAIRDAIEALLSTPSGRAPQWQDITTAPKNRDILLWWPYWSKRPTIGYWKHDRWIAENALSDSADHGPTHWMLLPTQPDAEPKP